MKQQLLAFARHLLASALCAGAVGAASATAVFSNATSIYGAGNGGNYVLTVSDATPGSLQWTLDVQPWNAEVLALFVDFGTVTMPSSIGLSHTSPSGAITLFARDTSSSSCGSGCNLNGLALPALGGGDWELVFRLGDSGFQGIQSWNWTTSDFGLDAADIRLIGIRAQQLCSAGQTLPDGSCGGSDKAFAWPNPAPQNLVPTGGIAGNVASPGTATLALGALAAAAWLRRRRRR